MLIDQTHTQEAQQCQDLREAERHQAELWVRALASGWTAAAIAAATGMSLRTVHRRLAQARVTLALADCEANPDSTPTPEPSELPRLVLTDSETSGSSPPTNGLRYALASDSISLDGGRTWIPPDDPSTPRMPVLVSSRNGPGSRKQLLEPRPYQAPPEPPGPTSYRPSKALKGGRGS
jgi:hypothetical protein